MLICGRWPATGRSDFKRLCGGRFQDGRQCTLILSLILATIASEDFDDATSGCGSATQTKYRPFTGSAEDWIEPVITDLRRCGLLRDDDQILCRKAMLLPYANIIFDHERASALETIHGYLDEVGIAYCGRYGDWGYLWTDESFKSGENAAQKALQQLAGRKRRVPDSDKSLARENCLVSKQLSPNAIS